MSLYFYFGYKNQLLFLEFKAEIVVTPPPKDETLPAQRPITLPTIVIHEASTSGDDNSSPEDNSDVSLAVSVSCKSVSQSAEEDTSLDSMRKPGGGPTVGLLKTTPTAPMSSNALGAGGQGGPVSKATIAVSDVDGRAFDILLR